MFYVTCAALKRWLLMFEADKRRYGKSTCGDLDTVPGDLQVLRVGRSLHTLTLETKFGVDYCRECILNMTVILSRRRMRLRRVAALKQP